MMSKLRDTAPSGPVAYRAFLACRWDDVVLTGYDLVIRWKRGEKRGQLVIREESLAVESICKHLEIALSNHHLRLTAKVERTTN
jgi:hypothetical protein